MLTVAGIINAIGVTIFISPVNLYDSGITKLNARGGYSNRKKAMRYFIVNRFQVARMKDIIHQIDPQAYITISEVADVYSLNNDK